MTNKCIKSVDSDRSQAVRQEIIILDFKEKGLEQQVRGNTIIQLRQSINKIIMKTITKIMK